METKTLEELLKETIEDLKNGKISKRVTSFTDYKSKYAILKPKVEVEVKLGQGITATIDITDFFEKEVA